MREGGQRGVLRFRANYKEADPSSRIPTRSWSPGRRRSAREVQGRRFGYSHVEDCAWGNQRDVPRLFRYQVVMAAPNPGSPPRCYLSHSGLSALIP